MSETLQIIDVNSTNRKSINNASDTFISRFDKAVYRMEERINKMSNAKIIESYLDKLSGKKWIIKLEIDRSIFHTLDTLQARISTLGDMVLSPIIQESKVNSNTVNVINNKKIATQSNVKSIEKIKQTASRIFSQRSLINDVSMDHIYRSKQYNVVNNNRISNKTGLNKRENNNSVISSGATKSGRKVMRLGSSIQASDYVDELTNVSDGRKNKAEYPDWDPFDESRSFSSAPMHRAVFNQPASRMIVPTKEVNDIMGSSSREMYNSRKDKKTILGKAGNWLGRVFSGGDWYKYATERKFVKNIIPEKFLDSNISKALGKIGSINTAGSAVANLLTMADADISKSDTYVDSARKASIIEKDQAAPALNVVGDLALEASKVKLGETIPQFLGLGVGPLAKQGAKGIMSLANPIHQKQEKAFNNSWKVHDTLSNKREIDSNKALLKQYEDQKELVANATMYTRKEDELGLKAIENEMLFTFKDVIPQDELNVKLITKNGLSLISEKIQQDEKLNYSEMSKAVKESKKIMPDKKDSLMVLDEDIQKGQQLFDNRTSFRKEMLDFIDSNPKIKGKELNEVATKLAEEKEIEGMVFNYGNPKSTRKYIDRMDIKTSKIGEELDSMKNRSEVIKAGNESTYNAAIELIKYDEGIDVRKTITDLGVLENAYDTVVNNKKLTKEQIESVNEVIGEFSYDDANPAKSNSIFANAFNNIVEESKDAMNIVKEWNEFFGEEDLASNKKIDVGLSDKELNVIGTYCDLANPLLVANGEAENLNKAISDLPTSKIIDIIYNYNSTSTATSSNSAVKSSNNTTKVGSGSSTTKSSSSGIGVATRYTPTTSSSSSSSKSKTSSNSPIGITNNSYSPMERFTNMKNATKNANGGILTHPITSLVAEDGPESIIPLSGKRRNRGVQLWEQTGKILGIYNRGINDSIFDQESVGDFDKFFVDNSNETYLSNLQPESSESSSVNINVNLTPSFSVQSNDEEKVVYTIKSHIREMADDIGDEIAERLDKVFSNMPLKKEA